MEIKYAPKFTKMFNPEIAEALGITLSDEFVAIAMDD
jgi:putative ABC transport system substrate-binding protein